MLPVSWRGNRACPRGDSGLAGKAEGGQTKAMSQRSDGGGSWELREHREWNPWTRVGGRGKHRDSQHLGAEPQRAGSGESGKWEASAHRAGEGLVGRCQEVEGPHSSNRVGCLTLMSGQRGALRLC